MLFFIFYKKREKEICGYSNTSHVILYLYAYRYFGSIYVDSNTSHVILYRRLWGFRNMPRLIQIHLMLFFIERRKQDGRHKRAFKYISCYSLSWVMPTWDVPTWDSNTSHVILYQVWSVNVRQFYAFKYISCYSLSGFRMGAMASGRDSNTSHVILYHVDHGVNSGIHFIQIHLMLFFIRSVANGCTCQNRIQIHLMLFFIFVRRVFLWRYIAFKYISCYSLSQSESLHPLHQN